MGRQRRDGGGFEILMVDGLEQLFRTGHAEMRQHARREAGRLTAPIGLAHDGAQRETAHPIAAALVAEHVAPSTRSRGVAVAIAAVRDRPGAGDDDDAAAAPIPACSAISASLTTRMRALYPMRLMMPRTTVASSGRSTPAMPRQMAAGTAVCCAHRFFHHRVKNLLELQLANRLEIGAGAFGRRQHPAFLVAEEANGLCAADVNAKDVHEV